MAIIIDLKSTDSTTEQRIDAVNAKLDQLNANLKTVHGNFRAASGAGSQFANSAARSRSRGGGARRTGAPPVDPNRILNDPQLRAQVLQGDPWASAAYNKAAAQQRAVTRAQKSINPPPAPTFQQNMVNMLMRSRYGGGGGSGGVMPLGMDVAKLFGGGKGGGIAAAAVALVVVKLKLLAKELEVARSAARGWASAAVAGGMRGAGAAATLGAFTGAGPGGAASAVRGRGAMESAFGASRGISPLAGHPFFDPGGANAAYEKMARAVVAASRRGGFAEAQKEASRLGAPELAKLAMVSRQTQEMLLSSNRRAVSGFAASTNAEFEAQWLIFKREATVLFQTHLTPFIKVANTVLSKWSERLMALNDVIDRIFGNDPDREKKQSAHDQAMDEHTRAMREHAEYLGGGRRTQGAVPRGLQGNPAAWMDREATRQSVRMGALF